MAFTVETGSGSATANSLCSVAVADSYHTERGNAAWGVLTQTVRENLLVKATAYLMNAAVFPWRGKTQTAEQALAWPRSGAVELYGQPVAESSVPLKVQHACANLAWIANTTELQPVGTTAAAGVKRQKIGDLEVEYFQASSTDTSSDPATQTAQTSEAMGLVRPLLRVAGTLTLGAPGVVLPPRVEVTQVDRPLFYVGQHDNGG